MKIASNKTGLYLRLGAVAAALLFGQQALAAGTRAGTVVENTASVDYQVNTIDQTAVPSNTVSFVVDRRVDFTWTLVSTPDLEPVTPGGINYFVDFVLTNTSNSDLDFNLALNQASGIPVDGSGNDNADMATVDYAISGNTVAGGDPDPVRGVNTGFIDELPADAAIRVRVYGDAALTMLDGQIAGVILQAEARAPGTAAALGAVLTYGGPNTDALENVDANSNGGIQVAVDGFVVESATLAATKAYSVVSDPLSSGLAVPGAVVEYTITIVNSGGTAAGNVSVTDTLDGDVTFLLGAYGGAGLDIEIDNNGAVTQCSADAAGADTDGCSLDGTALVVGNANGPISIAGGTTLVVSFQVEIPDPATTP